MAWSGLIGGGDLPGLFYGMVYKPILSSYSPVGLLADEHPDFCIKPWCNHLWLAAGSKTEEKEQEVVEVFVIGISYYG